MQYFFNDYIQKIKAPQVFVERVMCSLDSELVNEGDVVVSAGNQMDYCFFVAQGKCTLYGVHEYQDQQYKIPVVKLGDAMSARSRGLDIAANPFSEAATTLAMFIKVNESHAIVR